MTTLTIILIISLIVTLLMSSYTISDTRKELADAKASLSAQETRFSRVMSAYDFKSKHVNTVNNSNSELRAELNDAHTYSRMHQRELKELRDNIKKLHAELGTRHKLKAIKFTANVPLSGWTPTEFKLGVGSCGLTVDRLNWSELDDRYVLTQYHSDGSRKEFEYLKTDIKGRIEKYLKD